MHVSAISRQLHNKHVVTKEATLNELRYMVEIAHWSRYLHFYHYYWVDTSVCELL